VKTPPLALLAPAESILSGFNAFGIDRWRRPGGGPVRTQTAILRDSQTYNVYEVLIPRFIFGESSPLSFGGCWVEVPSGTDEMLTAELLDSGQSLSSETIALKPLDPPAKQLTPQRLKVVFYGVQDWKQAAGERLATLPRQFAMVGGNVWSDYTIVQPTTPPTPTIDDLVRDRAAREFGVKEYWPNYASLLETGEGISAWASVAGATGTSHDHSRTPASTSTPTITAGSADRPVPAPMSSAGATSTTTSRND